MDMSILYFGLFVCGLITGLALLATDTMTRKTMEIEREQLKDVIKVTIDND